MISRCLTMPLKTIYSKLPVVVIVGATGTGKSKLAIDIAQKYNGEIISADSMQVYKGLDIITNKVTQQEQSLAKHHLLDFVDPLEDFNVHDFRNRAVNVIRNLHRDGKLPIIVGGTHYYIESVLWKVLIDIKSHDIQSVNKSLGDSQSSKGNDSSVNTSLVKSENSESCDGSKLSSDSCLYSETNAKHANNGGQSVLREGGVSVSSASDRFKDSSGSRGRHLDMPGTTEVLYKQLCDVDPERAKELHPSNRRKIIRSLEVLQQSGRRHSTLLQEQRAQAGGSVLGGGMRYPNTVVLWVHCQQEVLDHRLNGRVDDMMGRGLLKELHGFHESYNQQRLVSGDVAVKGGHAAGGGGLGAASSRLGSGMATAVPCESETIAMGHGSENLGVSSRASAMEGAAAAGCATGEGSEYKEISSKDSSSLAGKRSTDTGSSPGGSNSKRIKVDNCPITDQSPDHGTDEVAHPGNGEERSTDETSSVAATVTHAETAAECIVTSNASCGGNLNSGNVNEFCDTLDGISGEVAGISANYTEGIFQSIGFKEFHDYLVLPDHRKETDEALSLYHKGVELLKQATRRYARRQLRWIRNRFTKLLDREVPPMYSLDATDPSTWQETVHTPAMAVVDALLDGPPHNVMPVERIAAQPAELEGRFERHECSVCSRVFVGRLQWTMHLASHKHRKREGALTKERALLTKTLAQHITQRTVAANKAETV